MFALVLPLAVFAPAAQAAPTDLAGLLIFLAGAGASVVASWIVSRLIEGSGWFEPLSPEGKLFAVAGLTLVISIGATGLQQFFAANAGIAQAVSPYVTAALFALSFVGTQVAHGLSKRAQG